MVALQLAQTQQQDKNSGRKAELTFAARPKGVRSEGQRLPCRENRWETRSWVWPFTAVAQCLLFFWPSSLSAVRCGTSSPARLGTASLSTTTASSDTPTELRATLSLPRYPICCSDEST